MTLEEYLKSKGKKLVKTRTGDITTINIINMEYYEDYYEGLGEYEGLEDYEDILNKLSIEEGAE